MLNSIPISEIDYLPKLFVGLGEQKYGSSQFTEILSQHFIVCSQCSAFYHAANSVRLGLHLLMGEEERLIIEIGFRFKLSQQEGSQL